MRPAHVDWLREQVAAGTVVLAGRTDPPTGSVVLISGGDADAAVELLKDDPYAHAGLIEYRVEAVFTPVVYADALASLVS